MLYTKPALNPKTALVVRTTQWDYEDRVKQEDLYVDGVRVATSHEFTLEEIIQPCLDLGVQAIGLFDEEKEQASLNLFTSNSPHVHMWSDNEYYLDTFDEYDEATWDLLVTYADYKNWSSY